MSLFSFERPLPGRITGQQRSQISQQRHQDAKTARQQSRHNIEPIPDPAPWILAARKAYRNDYVRAHRKLFRNTTGLSDFGDKQKLSIRQSQDVIQNGGQLARSEPRGFAKTTRSTNEGLMGVLEGDLTYLIIVASEVSKANDIMSIITTNLVANRQLARLYPRVCEAFQRVQNNPANGMRQCYDGDLTFIKMTNDTLVFPTLPGEPSSGAVIQVKSLKNVRGTIYSVKEGPNKGKVLRPSLVLLDDVMKDEDARNPNTVSKIIDDIDRAISMAGTYKDPINMIYAGTPIAPDDVTEYYLYKAEGWSRVSYSMMESMPSNMEIWAEYGEILKAYNRDAPGDQNRARKEALEFYIANREAMDAGAEHNWQAAYSTKRHEISAIQSAMNILIIKGPDVFQTECQCNVRHKQIVDETRKATVDIIINKQHTYPEGIAPTPCTRVVSHIDINKQVLSYTTIAFTDTLEAFVLGRSTWPVQGNNWHKDRLRRTLQQEYPDHPTEEGWVSAGLRDVIRHLTTRVYVKPNNKVLHHDLILVDCGYLSDHIYNVCSEFPLALPCQGVPVKPEDKPLSMRHWPQGSTYHHFCATTHMGKRTELGLMVDVNYFKSMCHTMWLTPLTNPGSLSLYNCPKNEHLDLANHCNNEDPHDRICPKTSRHRIQWIHKKGTMNEYFDNIVGCIAGAHKLGCRLGVKKKIKIDIGESMYSD